MHMKPIMEGWRRYLTEGQTGVKFENVVVAVAQGDATGGTNGNLKMGDHGGKWKGTPFVDMARACLSQMGLQPAKDAQGRDIYDANARSYSTKGTGIAGDPKTDIIVDGKQISLKLPGPIQFSSGEGPSSEGAMRLALDEFLQRQTRTEKAAKWIVAKQLKDSVNNFFELLGQTYGKRYLPYDPKKEGYLMKVVKKAKADYNKKNRDGTIGTWPSAGMPKSLTHADGKRRNIRDVFATEDEWAYHFIKEFAIKNAWQNDRVSHESYDVFKAGTSKELKKKIKSLTAQSEEFFNILVDEWLTGRRAFASTPPAVAHHLLSPDGFYPIRTERETAALSSKWKNFITTDVRAKGREFISKSITVRIGFDANKYYASLLKAASTQVAKAVDGAVIEAASESSDIDDIAQQMIRDLLGDVVLTAEPSTDEVEFS